jgi:hypothetical protein
LENDGERQIGPLKLLMSGNGWEQELFVPAAFVRSVILPAVEHEVGHIVAAAHFGAVVFGIGFGPNRKRARMDGSSKQSTVGKNVRWKPSASSMQPALPPIFCTKAGLMIVGRARISGTLKLFQA